MSLTIKNFTVLNTTTGQMAINGRYNSTVLSIILSYTTYNNNTPNEIAVPGTPNTISSGGLQGKAHMSTSYIQIVRNLGFSYTGDVIYVPDGILRLVYIGGICVFNNTLLYAFTNNINSNIFSLTFNVAFAVNTTQTYGDYIDIPLPDTSEYPNLYIVFVLLKGAWENRTIVSGNICSISSTQATYNFCINPSQSVTDNDNSHFIIIQAKNTGFNIYSHLIIGMEDNSFAFSDKDYNDFIIALGSRYILDTQINDTNLN